jgi:hypothetical protein
VKRCEAEHDVVCAGWNDDAEEIAVHPFDRRVVAVERRRPAGVVALRHDQQLARARLRPHLDAARHVAHNRSRTRDTCAERQRAGNQGLVVDVDRRNVAGRVG